MQVLRQDDQLVITPGFPRGTVRVPLASVDAWDCLYEVLGRRFLAFHLGDRTAYVNLPRLQPAARDALVAQLTALLGQAPDQVLLENERDNAHWERLWEAIKTVGRYLRLFINPLRPPHPPRRPPTA